MASAARCGVLLAVEVGDPLDALAASRRPCGRPGSSGRYRCRNRRRPSIISTRNSPLPHPISSTDLPREVVAVRPTVAASSSREVTEALRETLGLLVARRVLRLADVERGVEDEAARPAEREDEVAARERARVVGVVEQQAAVHRDARAVRGTRGRRRCCTRGTGLYSFVFLRGTWNRAANGHESSDERINEVRTTKNHARLPGLPPPHSTGHSP